MYLLVVNDGTSCAQCTNFHICSSLTANYKKLVGFYKRSLTVYDVSVNKCLNVLLSNNKCALND